MARLQIDMLPVGDADALVVEVELDGPREVFLIDGGKDWEDGERVLRQLDAYYGGRIDHLILSHMDIEHVGGLVRVVETLDAGRIGHAWLHDISRHGVDVQKAIRLARGLAEQAQSTPVKTVSRHVVDSIEATVRLIGALREKGIPVTEPFADGHNRIGPFEVLGPTKAFFEESVRLYDSVEGLDEMVEAGISVRRRQTMGAGAAAEDDMLTQAIDDPETHKQASLILLLDYEGDRYLFPGDAGRRGFAACLQLEKARNLHWLKVPNHGSKHNLSPELLDLMKPALAYVSGSGVGINPHPALIAALKNRGATMYSTARSGNVWHRRGDVPPRTGYETRMPM
jgi:beta-lactamase superfamily II metal-dependent hydrolase